MKDVIYAMLLFCSLLIIGCGGDDDCAPADWAGLYTLDTTSITDCTTIADIDDAVQISTVGTSEDTINFGGFITALDGCSTSFTTGTLTVDAELDGSQLTLSAAECTIIYNK